MTNQRNGTLYIGVTSDLIKRVWQHKNEVADSFTKNINCILWFGMNPMQAWSLQSVEKRL